MSVKKSQRRKKNLYTEVDFENLIDAMMEHQVTIDSEVVSLNNIDQILDARSNCLY